jgi:hypothetical protein
MDSIKEAEATLSHVLELKETIFQAADKHAFPRGLIAGIISRETGGIPERFIGDKGRGVGPMQIDQGTDREFHDLYIAGYLTPTAGIFRGTEILAQKRREIERIFPLLKGVEQVRAYVAAYNCGAGAVHFVLVRKLDIDHQTTGGDYSKDVLARAEWFRGNGFGDAS